MKFSICGAPSDCPTWAVRSALGALVLFGSAVASGRLCAQAPTTPDAESRPTLSVANVPAGDDKAAARNVDPEAELLAGVTTLEKQARILRHVVKVVQPSVVHISAEKKASGPSNATGFVEEAGSGVIVQVSGRPFVMTNCHVIRGAPIDRIRLYLSSGRRLKPTRVLMDPESDIALLAVNASGIVPAKMGDSDLIEIGDYVLAIGSPFGLSHSVTHGIISARGRSDLELGIAEVRIQDFIQTDAAINPGNSGGPLINLRAEVIGINTAIASDSGVSAGIAFAIPVNIARQVAEQLVVDGKVRRGYLGVEMDAQFDREKAVTLGLPTTGGCRLVRVTSGSPADAAKLQVGDILWSFNGKVLKDDQDLVNFVALAPVDKPLPVVVYRQGKPLQLYVTLHAKH